MFHGYLALTFVLFFQGTRGDIDGYKKLKQVDNCKEEACPATLTPGGTWAP